MAGCEFNQRYGAVRHVLLMTDVPIRREHDCETAAFRGSQKIAVGKRPPTHLVGCRDRVGGS
jgi:hypothetical protein